MSLVALLMVGVAKGWVVSPTDSTATFRAISAPGGRVCWASGSKGTFARTLDGVNWKAGQVAQAKDAEFRSIVAFDANRAVMLAIGEGEASQIFRTEDGGATWVRTFRNPDKRAFYDAIAFWDREHGIAFGDPVEGQIPILITDDSGRTWVRPPSDRMPTAMPGEAAFAASGRCLVVRGSHDAWIATGGGAARVFHTSDRGRSWTVAPTAVPSGSGSAGLFGLLFWSDKEGIGVGGDYEKDAEPGYAIMTRDGGRTWPVLGFRPPGLREAAIRYGKGFMLVGPSGTDVSEDGRTWTTVKNPGVLHTVAASRKRIWAVGENGLIARWGE
ncbi:oxidoreductase [bacterium]|nr:MAG: oxidoreductase [bacterium]